MDAKDDRDTVGKGASKATLINKKVSSVEDLCIQCTCNKSTEITVDFILATRLSVKKTISAVQTIVCQHRQKEACKRGKRYTYTYIYVRVHVMHDVFAFIYRGNSLVSEGSSQSQRKSHNVRKTV